MERIRTQTVEIQLLTTHQIFHMIHIKFSRTIPTLKLINFKRPPRSKKLPKNRLSE